MRAWMNEGATYVDDVKVGEVMRAGAVGHVVKSNAPGLVEGDADGALAPVLIAHSSDPSAARARRSASCAARYQSVPAIAEITADLTLIEPRYVAKRRDES